MAQAQLQPPEYTIYTYARARPKNRQPENWQYHATLDDPVAAMSAAEDLYRTQKFTRVEIKKKFFDERRGRLADCTFRVFESRGRMLQKMMDMSNTGLSSVMIGLTSVLFLYGIGLLLAQ